MGSGALCQDRPREPRGFARAKTHPERNFTFVVWINTAVLILSGGESARAEAFARVLSACAVERRGEGARVLLVARPSGEPGRARASKGARSTRLLPTQL